MDDFRQTANILQTDLNPQNTVNETIPFFNLDMDDERLQKMLVNTLDLNISHWEQAPWQLQRTDIENVNYLLGNQLDDRYLLPHQTRYVDNRLHASVRAILAYVSGQLAKPSLLPSKTEQRYQRIAQNMEMFLYQHALDHEANQYMRLALKNLVSRKRGFLKLRFSEDEGPFGDICTDNVDPADIVIGRFSRYGQDPDIIYQKQKCSAEELVAKFPDKKNEIFAALDYKRGTFTQMSREVTYWECWFTYWDNKGKESEGVCWFLPSPYSVILGKMQNPNWLYKGSDRQQKIKNITPKPIKPYVWLNYLSTGRSFIDETCLLDQAIPMQDILNKRGRQIVENADYANPRLLVDKGIMEQADADKFVNKNPKTIGMVDTSTTNRPISDSVFMVVGQQLPSFVFQDKIDARSEIDVMMGTPTQFRGEQPQSKNPTLGQDLLIKNQANALQDDLVEVVNRGWRDYYTKLLQMSLVYLPDDYWVMTKGRDGQYNQIVLHDDNLDTNVRIGVQVDSTLPLDKQSQKATAIQLAQMPGRIDDLSLFEMLQIPDAEELAKRVSTWNLDKLTYMDSLTNDLMSAEAEMDMTLVIAGKQPQERDDYNEDYLNQWNLFFTTNRYQMLPPPVQQRLQAFLHDVANKAAMTQALQDKMVDPSGMLDRPPSPPMPKVDVRLLGQLDPAQSAQVGGLPPPQPQAAPPGGQNGSPQINAIQGAMGGSPPRIQTPPRVW